MLSFVPSKCTKQGHYNNLKKLRSVVYVLTSLLHQLGVLLTFLLIFITHCLTNDPLCSFSIEDLMDVLWQITTQIKSRPKDVLPNINRMQAMHCHHPIAAQL